jgi:hypothetical protein
MSADESQPRTRAFALHVLTMAVAALVLLAIVLSANGAGYGECVIYGHRNVSHFGALHGKYTADAGWIWLVNSSTVHVQGKVGTYTFLREVTIGGPVLQGGVVSIALNETTWYPPSGAKQVIPAEVGSVWSTPEIVDLSVTYVGDSTVNAKVGDFDLDVDRCRDWMGQHPNHEYMNMKLVKPMEDFSTGLCVNAATLTVSEADNLATHHSPSPSGDTMEETVAAA